MSQRTDELRAISQSLNYAEASLLYHCLRIDHGFSGPWITKENFDWYANRVLTPAEWEKIQRSHRYHELSDTDESLEILLDAVFEETKIQINKTLTEKE